MWATPAATVTLGASRQVVSNSQPRKLEPCAGRGLHPDLGAGWETTSPQVPVVSVAVKTQWIPAGWEVTRPPPVPPRASETLPLVAWNSVVTVRVADLVAPPAVPMMVDNCEVATGLVATVKVAAVAPAATVTLGGTVAAVGLSLDSETTTPPAGAEEVNETVAVTGVPPTTVVSRLCNPSIPAESRERPPRANFN
jgi:hypothetical protein